MRGLVSPSEEEEDDGIGTIAASRRTRPNAEFTMEKESMLRMRYLLPAQKDPRNGGTP